VHRAWRMSSESGARSQAGIAVIGYQLLVNRYQPKKKQTEQASGGLFDFERDGFGELTV
jgi:hypothetical protein